MENGLHSHRVHLTSGHSESCIMLPNIHPLIHIHTPMAVSWRQPAHREQCLAQGHHDTQLGRAVDRTSNLLVTSQPSLPPEPHSHVRKLHQPLTLLRLKLRVKTWKWYTHKVVVLSRNCFPIYTQNKERSKKRSETSEDECPRLRSLSGWLKVAHELFIPLDEPSQETEGYWTTANRPLCSLSSS